MIRRLPKDFSKAIWILIFYMLPILPLIGQDYPYNYNQYIFINDSLNKLEFFGDTTEFQKLFAKFDDLILNGQGQINIVHIGGSHIQADIFSGQVRKRLQVQLPGLKANRGFLFPYLMANTNNPSNYELNFTGSWESCKNVKKNTHCLLGLSGISVTTTDSLSTLSINPNADYYLDYEFNKVKIYHTFDSASYDVRLDLPDSSYRTIQNLRLGYTEFVLNQYADSINLVFSKTASNQEYFRLFGLSLDSDDPGFVYHAIGVNGADLPAYLRCDLLPQHLAALSPDLVIFSIGINDANNRYFNADVFSHHYDTLISRIKSCSPEVKIIFTTNNDSYYRRRYPNKNGEIVKRTMKQLAEKHNAAVWDLFSLMGGLGSIKNWETYLLAKKDKIHFTRDGYLLLGDMFYSALMKAYEEKRLINGNSPELK